MSKASNQKQVISEAFMRATLENIYLAEYLKWVNSTSDYDNNQKEDIHEICGQVVVKNGKKTITPAVKAIIEGLKKYEADRHARFIMIMLKQFSEMTFTKNFMAPYKYSDLHEAMVASNSKLGRYSSMFVPARNRATYARSRMGDTYLSINNVLNGRIKTVTGEMDLTESIKKMSFFELLDTITIGIYGSKECVPITKCNVPIIDIIIRMKERGSLDLSGVEANHNAMIVIRFFMMVESIFNQAAKIIEEDIVKSLKEIQDNCIPFNKADIATLTTLGLDSTSFQKDNKAIAGAIKFEDRNTFTKIVIESVILAEYIAQVKQNQVIDGSSTLIKGLRFIAASEYKRLSVIHGLGLLSKFLAYSYDFRYVDTVCGWFGLNLQEATLPMNYPDLYGMIYKIAENQHCYSVSPRVKIDIDISADIWRHDRIEFFERQHFDNGFGRVIHDTLTSDEETKRRDRFVRLSYGYDLCATYIAELPKFVKTLIPTVKATKDTPAVKAVPRTPFDDILHCVLKATIGYPADFSKRNIYVEKNEKGKVTFKDGNRMQRTKKFGLERIVIHRLDTAITDSKITPILERTRAEDDNYFVLVTSDGKQFSYKRIVKPEGV